MQTAITVVLAVMVVYGFCAWEGYRTQNTVYALWYKPPSIFKIVPLEERTEADGGKQWLVDCGGKAWIDCWRNNYERSKT